VLEVADVSGAGDTALAAFSVSIAEEFTIDEAAVMSNVAAGVAASKLGTAVVSRSELNAAFARATSAAYHPGSVALKSTAVEMAATWRRMGERVVFTNCCFDLIHAGHIGAAFVCSAGRGSIDRWTQFRRVGEGPKGPTRPIQTEADRARIVGALRVVDLVVLFDDLHHCR
jgi:D-beta-D-heptose 7-phosphate kinase / D-beta-D-heptose 1-phosphate adenosyltransferase